MHSFCTTYPGLAQRLVYESGSSQPLQISDPWYPFALMGIHITRTILETLSAGLLQQSIIMKVKGDVIESVARTCQDLYGMSIEFRGLMKDQLVEEFHEYWIDLVKEGSVKNIFDFERVFSEFKRDQGML